MKINKLRKMPMVNWFDPSQLMDTAIKIIFSTIIGEQSDKRVMQAIASSRKEYYDYTRLYDESSGRLIADKESAKEIWIDYISDTGDGWNPTYTVAYYAAQPSLDLKFKDKTYHTKRGDILIFGGDEVYPTPSRENYKRRLVIPYENAFGADAPERNPHVFAIPGNHDWYDGLSSFSRLFFSDVDRSFSGWRTRQKRSYFALKLPAGWWLLGSDGQLQSDIDTPQIEYFRTICEKYMKEGEKVMLCIAQPNWIYAHKYQQFGELYDESDLLFLQNEILGKKNIDVKVFLAGDYHHYRRHEEIDAKDKNAKVQKITAGGGGAFLHPTHDIDVSVIREDYGEGKMTSRSFELKESYPDIKTSRNLTFRNLYFLFSNPAFGIITAILYLLTAWLVGSSVGYRSPGKFLDTFIFTGQAIKNNPVAAIWIILLALAFIFFTDTHSKIYKWSGGLLHVAAHLIAIFYIGWGAIFLSNIIFGSATFLGFLLSSTLIFILGWIVGSTLMGIYFFISQYFFGRHNEESFSAIKIQDYKNFLRLHISEDGNLTIYPVKIETVARKWRDRDPNENSGIKSFIVPLDGSGPELIEKPVVLKPGAS